MWQPGESGNPAGRPRKAHSLTQMLREYGERVDEEGGPTRAQQLAEVMWKAALKGDRDIAKYIIDRQDGKPKERVETNDVTVNPIYEMLKKLTEQNAEPKSETDQLHSAEQS